MGRSRPITDAFDAQPKGSGHGIGASGARCPAGISTERVRTRHEHVTSVAHDRQLHMGIDP